MNKFKQWCEPMKSEEVSCTNPMNQNQIVLLPSMKKRNTRLQSAKEWIKIYEGFNIVKGYSKKYGVDKICAIYELRMIGIAVSDDYEKQLRQSMEALKQQRESRKAEKESEFLWDSDENFAAIIGYTPGEAPYGVTHEEWEEIVNNTESE